MPHATISGANFLALNSPFTGAFGPTGNVHSFVDGVFQPGVTPQALKVPDIIADLFGDCPVGQVKIPGTDICINIPFLPGDPTGCNPGFHDDGSGGCVVDDPSGFPDTPAERGGLASGPALPSRIARNVFVCPKFQDGSSGILYFSPLTDQVVCLPRSMSPKAAMAFGLLRKNKPRAKALVTAADGRLVAKISSIQGKIANISAKAGLLACPPKKKR